MYAHQTVAALVIAITISVPFLVTPTEFTEIAVVGPIDEESVLIRALTDIFVQVVASTRPIAISTQASRLNAYRVVVLRAS